VPPQPRATAFSFCFTARNTRAVRFCVEGECSQVARDCPSERDLRFRRSGHRNRSRGLCFSEEDPQSSPRCECECLQRYASSRLLSSRYVTFLRQQAIVSRRPASDCPLSSCSARHRDKRAEPPVSGRLCLEGGPLKPDFGLSGDVTRHRLSPTDKLNCPPCHGG